jgi:hypothetical protein
MHHTVVLHQSLKYLIAHFSVDLVESDEESCL